MRSDRTFQILAAGLKKTSGSLALAPEIQADKNALQASEAPKSLSVVVEAEPTSQSCPQEDQHSKQAPVQVDEEQQSISGDFEPVADFEPEWKVPAGGEEATFAPTLVELLDRCETDRSERAGAKLVQGGLTPSHEVVLFGCGLENSGNCELDKKSTHDDDLHRLETQIGEGSCLIENEVDGALLTIQETSSQSDWLWQETADAQTQTETRKTLVMERTWKLIWQQGTHGTKPAQQEDQVEKTDSAKRLELLTKQLRKYTSHPAFVPTSISFALLFAMAAMIPHRSAPKPQVVASAVVAKKAGAGSALANSALVNSAVANSEMDQSRFQMNLVAQQPVAGHSSNLDHSSKTRLNQRKLHHNVNMASAGSEEQKESLRNKALREQINQLDANSLKSVAYESMRKGDYNRAVVALMRAVKLNPNDALARKYLAHALLSSGDSANALSQYRAFEQLSADGADRAGERINFGIALARAENKDPAEAYFDQMIIESGNDSAKLRLIEQKCEALGLSTQASNAAFLGMKSGTPAQRYEFQQIYSRLNGKKDLAPAYDKSLPRLS